MRSTADVASTVGQGLFAGAAGTGAAYAVIDR